LPKFFSTVLLKLRSDSPLKLADDLILQFRPITLRYALIIGKLNKGTIIGLVEASKHPVKRGKLMLAQERPLGMGGLDYQTLVERFGAGGFGNRLRKLAYPVIIMAVGIVEAYGRFAGRAKAWWPASFMEFDVGFLVGSFEKDRTIIAAQTIFGLLIGFTLPTLLMVYDCSHPGLEHGGRVRNVDDESF
jgi:hypothetical protein